MTITSNLTEESSTGKNIIPAEENKNIASEAEGKRLEKKRSHKFTKVNSWDEVREIMKDVLEK